MESAMFLLELGWCREEPHTPSHSDLLITFRGPEGGTSCASLSGDGPSGILYISSCRISTALSQECLQLFFIATVRP